MNKMLDSLNIDDIEVSGDYAIDINGKTYKLDVLNNLKKINIFIGPNNSGKSRFLRNLFTKKLYRGHYYNDLNYESTLFDLTGMVCEGFYTVLERIYGKKIKDFISESISNFSQDKKEELGKEVINLLKPLSLHEQDFNFKKCIQDIIYKQKSINDFTNYEIETTVYIPVLRGCRSILYGETKELLIDKFINTSGGNYSDAYNHINRNDNDVYYERTKKDYFYNINIGMNNNINISESNNRVAIIHTGLNMYHIVKEFLLGDLTKRELIREYEEFLSKEFFGERSISLIPKHNQDILTIKIGDTDERTIDQLGDGIQAIINITFPVFMYKNSRALFFIEEPELYMHPGLQRQFINTITSNRFPELQFFITTHSNHLLDLTLEHQDISVYKFSSNIEGKKEQFVVENVSNDDLRVLEELGVKNSSVFLSNCTIWVEGITDVAYLRKYIELYQKENSDNNFKEDRDYSFIIYGGNNIVQWSFLDEYNKDEALDKIKYDRIANRIFVLADSDESNTKSERFKKLEECVGKDNCEMLKVKEIENLLSHNIIKEVVKEFNPKLEFISGWNDVNINNDGLGKIIEENLILSNIEARSKQKFRSPSGTLNSNTKKVFCKLAINRLNHWDDLTQEAKYLTEKIIKFIDRFH